MTKPAGLDGEKFEQMTDIYGVPCDVQHVRTFRNKREMGGGYDSREPAAWFVYDRENASAKWHKHCGPYSSFDQTKDWINSINDRREVQPCSDCGGSGSLPDMTCCRTCGGGGRVLR
jgi:hypothetical protein